MSADSMVANVMSNVPKAMAAGVVDMSTGMLLAVKTVDSHPQQVLDLVAAATRDLFEGDTVVTIEDHFRRSRGDAGSKYFREIIVNSHNLTHVFGRLNTNENIVLVAVLRADANLGMVLAKFREIATTQSI
ncbi:MAG: hypothetical protein ACPG4N_07840 [Gammaproteobacteria bacterium]